MPQPTWSARVRYAETDQQGVVFNAHYLGYCDEALGAFCAQRGLLAVAEALRVASSTLTWSAPARWGDTVEVVVQCERIGRTSLRIAFDVRAAGHPCCRVSSTYVLADPTGTPIPIPDEVRAALGHAAAARALPAGS